MSRSGDEWIKRTGGFRLGETKEEFDARVKEIEVVEKRLTFGTLKFNEIEDVQRQLCALKGIDFDEDNVSLD